MMTVSQERADKPLAQMPPPLEDPARRRALVFGDDTRSFLACVRSLARAGIEVHAAPFSFASAALHSRYISALHTLPYFLGDGQAWLQALDALLQRYDYTFILPCDERALYPLSVYRAQFEGRAALALPNPQGLDVFFDKLKTRALAERLGVPIARGRLIRTGDQAADLIAEAGLPLAIKPNASFTLAELYTRGKVVIARSEGEVARALAGLGETPHFFEAFFAGRGAGVSVLAHEGKILQAFQHARVHELNGASHYRVSVPLSPDLVDAVEKLVAATSYCGLAMFEFRLNDEGAWILLEVNARPWGSLPLPVALGVDFPFLWYRLVVDGVAEPRRSYRAGIYGRNAGPDIRYMIASARALRGRPLSLARFIVGGIGEYGRIALGREVHDVWVRDDPAPALAEAREELAGVASRLGQLLPGSETRARRAARAALGRALSAASPGRLNIAVVCQGNICRSPFAAALLRRALVGTAADVASYANLPREGRPSPDTALTAAEAYGVDLSSHRSVHFSPEAAASADLVVIFDAINRQWLHERYPALKAPVILLGSFAGDAKVVEIADPDGAPLERFNATYAAIAAGVDGLAAEIRARIHG